MGIAEAMFDQASGDPITIGQITITSRSGEQLKLADHKYLKLTLGSETGWPRHMSVSAVEGLEKLDSGLYAIKLGGPSVNFFGLTQKDFLKLKYENSETSSIGYRLPARGGTISPQPNEPVKKRPQSSLSNFTVSLFPQDGGIKIIITGKIGESQPGDGNSEIDPNWTNAAFQMETVLEYYQVVLANNSIDGDWLTSPPKEPKRSKVAFDKNPASGLLKDLLYSFLGPIVHAKVELAPRIQGHGQSPNALYLHFRDYAERFEFREIQGIGLTSDGLCVAGVGTYSLAFNVGRRWLEKALLGKRQASLSLLGDEIGELSYLTIYAEAPVVPGPFGRAAQSIKTLDIRASLNETGLTLVFGGEFDDYSSGLKEHFLAGDKPNLIPAKTFLLQALIPWNMLLVRKYSFARRPKEFLAGEADTL